MTANDIPLSTAEPIPVGNYYEDFEVGQRFQHHWGRTLTDGDNARFTTLRLNANPLHFNEEYADANGHDDVILDPLLVFNTVLGLSVEDLSERDTLFLGIEDCTFHKQLEVGATLTAESEVLEKRESNSRPDYGIVTWRTVGRDGEGDRVIDYERTNLVPRESAQEAT
ncbi:MaoC family dehydratase [Halobacteriales archaeon Cl-PHB]